MLVFLNQQGGLRNNVLLVTGQAGVGKSATIHLIASILGLTVYEWNAPIPTVWQEHVHNSSSGTGEFLFFFFFFLALHLQNREEFFVLIPVIVFQISVNSPRTQVHIEAG